MTTEMEKDIKEIKEPLKECLKQLKFISQQQNA